jgi:hypothetical protein
VTEHLPNKHFKPQYWKEKRKLKKPKKSQQLKESWWEIRCALFNTGLRERPIVVVLNILVYQPKP